MLMDVGKHDIHFIRIFSTVSAAKNFRSGCGEKRKPPALVSQRSPTAAPQVGQPTDDNCLCVSCFTFIPKWYRYDIT